jgi:hypothetical protein
MTAVMRAVPATDADRLVECRFEDAGPELNKAADDMAAVQQQAIAEAAALGGTFVFHNPDPEFAGHRICDTDEGINDFVLAPTGAGDFSCPVGINPKTWVRASMESFHPNDLGTTLYATAFEHALQ